MGLTSLKQLEEAIKNRPSIVINGKFVWKRFVEHETWFADFTKDFDAFKKQNVCIPRKQLEELIKNHPHRRYPMDIQQMKMYKEYFEKLEKLLEESK